MTTPGVISIVDDGLVTEGQGFLNGWQFDCSADGGQLTIYDGIDPESGRLLFNPSGWQYDANNSLMPLNIPFEKGLYVVLSATVTRASIVFTPKRGYTPPTVETVAQALLDLINR